MSSLGKNNFLFLSSYLSDEVEIHSYYGRNMDCKLKCKLRSGYLHKLQKFAEWKKIVRSRTYVLILKNILKTTHGWDLDEAREVITLGTTFKRVLKISNQVKIFMLFSKLKLMQKSI